jgi:hypothetical protein
MFYHTKGKGRFHLGKKMLAMQVTAKELMCKMHRHLGNKQGEQPKMAQKN